MLLRVAPWLALSVAAGADDCSLRAPLALSLWSPGDAGAAGKRTLEIEAAPGEELEVPVYLGLRNLTTSVQEIYTCSGTFAVAVAQDIDVLEIQAASFEGTDYGAVHNFEFIWLARALSPDAPAPGFVAADPGCFVAVGPHSVAERFSLARAQYRLRPLPPAAAGAVIATSIRFEDGLLSPGGSPISNHITVDGRTVIACLEPLEIRIQVRDPREFLRADANRDWVLDISDAVTVLRTLFEYGDAPVRCADAADANDDGKIDISDAVSIFTYLFGGGRAPSPPFSEPGLDPTADGLGCRELAG